MPANMGGYNCSLGLMKKEGRKIWMLELEMLKYLQSSDRSAREGQDVSRAGAWLWTILWAIIHLA